MDGNPVALQDPHAYRRFAVERVKTLRHLDLKRVTDAERRAVALESQKEDERRRAAEKHEMLEPLFFRGCSGLGVLRSWPHFRPLRSRT